MENTVCIIGAGPAGASTALSLAKHNIPCILFDKATFPRDKICGDAFSGKVQWALKQLGLFNTFYLSKTPYLASWGVTFYGSKNNELKVPFKLSYDTAKDRAPGFVAKRIDFDNFLIKEVIKSPLIDFRPNSPVISINSIKEGYSLNLKNDEKVIATYLFVANGASPIKNNSTHQKFSDTKTSIGLRTYYTGVKKLDRDGFIELHFLEDLLPGYFWIFPLPNGMANVGLGMRKDIAKRKKINLKKIFYDCLKSNKYISERFEDAKQLSKPQLYALPFGNLSTYVDGNCMFLGDAARLIDPFTGEGIGNAMISGILAANTLANKLQDNLSSLQEYNALIKSRFGTELRLSQALQHLSKFPTLFNFVVNKANSNKDLKELIVSMFNDVDVRKTFLNPLFYLNLIRK